MNSFAASTPVIDSMTAPSVIFLAETSARVWDETAATIGATATPAMLEDFADSIDAATLQLTAFAHDLGDGPHHLVAASRAGVSAARVALARPELVASCTLVNPWALAPGGGRMPVSADAAQLGRARGEVYRGLIQRGMPCPTLLVWSIDDPAGDRDGAAALNEIFMRRQRETELRYFARTGTDVFRERPAAFARMLSAFLTYAMTR